MNLLIHKQKSLSVVYDGSLLDSPLVDYFRAEYWQSLKLLIGQARGRGSAWFIDAPFGPVVLRQYLRGGWAAKISRDRYLFSDVSRSRPFREFHLLTALHQQGLPVPRPVAALCEHHGLLASGAIISARIPAVQTLAEWLEGAGTDPGNAGWPSVGNCIRKFHDAGIWHADLNARNILLDSEQQVFLLDFDRARFTPGQKVSSKRNLSRLKRSLIKLWPPAQMPSMQPAWKNLMDGYHG